MKVHRSSNELQDTIEGYKDLVDQQKKEIWELKKIFAENEQNKNLIIGYKKIITELTDIINKNNVR